MKEFVMFLVLIAAFRDTLFWLLIFILNLCFFIKSNSETDINEKSGHLKLDKWAYMLQMFCGVIGIINSFDILKSITSIVIIILSIIGLTLQILSLKLKGVAAKKLNRKFIGIELEPKYFEIAKNRIENT